MPLLEKEYRNAAQRLTATQEELTDLAPERLKEKVSGLVPRGFLGAG